MGHIVGLKFTAQVGMRTLVPYSSDGKSFLSTIRKFREGRKKGYYGFFFKATFGIG